MPAQKFKSVEELQTAIDRYFDSCYDNVIVKDKDGKVIIDGDGNVIRERQQVEPLTITGLALALDTTRDVLMDVENGNGPYGDKRYSYAIKKAKLQVEHGYEVSLRGDRNPAGSIFGLKNFGWRDTQDINMSLDGVEITIGKPKSD